MISRKTKFIIMIMISVLVTNILKPQVSKATGTYPDFKSNGVVWCDANGNGILDEPDVYFDASDFKTLYDRCK